MSNKEYSNNCPIAVEEYCFGAQSGAHRRERRQGMEYPLGHPNSYKKEVADKPQMF